MGTLYVISNRVNNKLYIGITEHTAEARLLEHLSVARCGRGYYLHNAIRRHGVNAFSISTLYVYPSIDDAKAAEIETIAALRAFGYRLYNIKDGGCAHNVGASALRGRSRSAETRAKIAATLKGHAVSDTARSKMAAAKLGKKRSPEIGARIGAKHRGMKRSDETRARMSLAQKARFARDKIIPLSP